jgi:hypothetical protein
MGFDAGALVGGLAAWQEEFGRKSVAEVAGRQELGAPG